MLEDGGRNLRPEVEYQRDGRAPRGRLLQSLPALDHQPAADRGHLTGEEQGAIWVVACAVPGQGEGQPPGRTAP